MKHKQRKRMTNVKEFIVALAQSRKAFDATMTEAVRGIYEASI